MAPRGKLTLPTLSALPSSNRLPSSNPTVRRTLSRLSRSALLALIQEWLQPLNQTTCAPYLGGGEGEEDTAYEIAASLEELRESYRVLSQERRVKGELLDRVLHGDWRHGVSLRQLAMADIQYLLDHPASQRWTALRLVPVPIKEGLQDEEIPAESQCSLPAFHAPTFLKNLQQEIGSVGTAHYHLTRMSSLPISLLRICLYDSPYSSQNSMRKPSSPATMVVPIIIYIAFPDNVPAVYVSFGAATRQPKLGDAKNFRKIVIDALPKALSRPQKRYTLKPTSLSARSLSSLVAVRGPGSGNAAAGGWSIFADGTVEESPLTESKPTSAWARYGHESKENNEVSGEPYFVDGQRKNAGRGPGKSDEAEPQQKRRKLLADTRCGQSVSGGSKGSIERFEVRLEDAFSVGAGDDSEDLSTTTAQTARTTRKVRRSVISLIEEHTDDIVAANGQDPPKGWIPGVRLIFSGADVFSGIKGLVESGAVDGSKMPGWMTGESTVSVGVIRNGRIRGDKGTGFQ